jgi:hypothetical protein
MELPLLLQMTHRKPPRVLPKLPRVLHKRLSSNWSLVLAVF